MHRARGESAAFSKALSKPVLDNFKVLRLARYLIELPYTVQPDAMGPLPAVPAFCLDGVAIFQMQEKLACIIANVYEVVNEKVDDVVDFGDGGFRRHGTSRM